MRNGAGFRHVDGVAEHLEPGRDDVAERDELADVTVERHAVHAVVVPVGDEEPATVALHRVLDSGREEDVRVRRIGDGKRSDVGDDAAAVRAVHAIDAVDVVLNPDRWEWVADERDQRVRGIADERDVHRPAKWDDLRGQAARERR